MREYGKVTSKFWTGSTGKALRQHPEAQLVALYLMTCTTSDMTGVFQCPLLYIAHETGLGMEGANKGLQRLFEVDFCTYDFDAEMVFVHEMAKFQIGEELKVSDNQVKFVKKAFQSMFQPFKEAFFARYQDAFHLIADSPSQVPSKTLLSQEQEQEKEQQQEQEQNQNKKDGAGAPGVSVPAVAELPKASSTTKEKKTISQAELVAMGVEAGHAQDWLTARQKKSLPLTRTALDGVVREAAQAGMTLPAAIKHAAGEGWAGFKAKWLNEGNRGASGPAGARGQAHAGFDQRDYGAGGKL